MTKGEAVNWIINLRYDIGKAEHQDLWHYEQVLLEIKEMLESSDIVSREFVRQIQWERDIAIQQLKEVGLNFGEEPNKDCNTRLEGFDPENLTKKDRSDIMDALDFIWKQVIDGMENEVDAVIKDEAVATGEWSDSNGGKIYRVNERNKHENL